MALQNPYTDIQIVTISENLIESTSFYMMEFREWNRTDKAQKTWVTSNYIFRGHFEKTGTSLGKLCQGMAMVLRHLCQHCGVCPVVCLTVHNLHVELA